MTNHSSETPARHQPATVLIDVEQIDVFRSLMKGPAPDPTSPVVQKIDALCDMARAYPRLLSIVRKAALGSGGLRDEAFALLRELGEI